MGVRTKNLAALFANSRTRTIIIITAIVLIFAVLVGYFGLRNQATGPGTNATLTATPQIQTIPGALNPTEEYSKLLQQQNVQKATEAKKTGGSAIPTIISTNRPGEGQLTGQAAPGQPWQTGLGFQRLAQVESSNLTPKNLLLQNLAQNRCSAADLQKAKQLGATVEELRKAGCTADQLKQAGWTPAQLQQGGFSACDQVSNNGADPKALKNAGYSAGELRGVGLNACQMKAAGFTANELAQAGFSPAELKGVGFAAGEIPTPPIAVITTPQETGLPPGVTAAALKAAGCSPAAVRAARAKNVSAAAMRKIGCSAAQLSAGGYNPTELKNAGYTAGELLKAGFTPEDLKRAGYSAADMLQAGLKPADIAAKGYTPAQIATGDRQLEASGVPSSTAQSLKNAGCTPAEIAKARTRGINARALRAIGCTPTQLRAGGYSPADLKDAGFTAGELNNAGISVAQLKQAGSNPCELKDAGVTLKALKDAGYTAEQLKACGFTAAELKNAGFTAAELKNAGFTPAELKNAGFTPAELKNAGFTADDLKAAGFTPEQIESAGFTPAEAGVVPAVPVIAAPAVSAVVPLNPPVDAQAAALLQQQTQQQQQLAAQQLQQLQAQVQGTMQAQVNQLFAAWQPPNQVYVEGSAPVVVANAAGTVVGPGGVVTAVGPGGVPLVQKVLVKAGTIMFGVVDTAVNSDEPGPVLATIVQGSLKGGRLIGRFSSFPPHGQKVMLTFENLSLDTYSATIPVNAVAIDPDTARTALSSDTNNHYCLRYGTLFAASFLQGYGQAFLQSGQIIENTASSTIVASPPLSGGGKVFVALGNVGNQFGNALQNVFNTPPTVQVFAGTGVGILFLTDLVEPAPLA